MPDGFLIPSSGNNNSAAILDTDGHTLIQVQPLTRCSAGGIATSIVRYPDGDLYGDGIQGAHGGSGMSSLGGTLRLGELKPGQTGPKHALKFVVYMKEAYACTKMSDCFRWPAVQADSYALGFYGSGASNPNQNNTAMKMGALLALPAGLDLTSLGLETEPGKQMAWTLQNYGAYIVDDTYDAAFTIATENSPAGAFVEQFQTDYGVAFNQSSDADVGWTRDVQRIVPKLEVVDNNGPGSIGGGGTPLQPLAPPL